MLFKLTKPIAYKLKPETSHNLVMKALSAWPMLMPKISCEQPVELMGLTFRNRLGLAAGYDKNAVALKAFDYSGLGFIEVGTITPKPQSGNDKPRIFRLTNSQAIINRMGFNNQGATKVCSRVAANRGKIKALIGINIGKNKTTPNKKAVDDYLYAMERAYLYADYITINISSPNTENLRDLQHGLALSGLLGSLKEAQREFSDSYNHYAPLVVKIAPDNDADTLKAMLDIIANNEMDGIIATNTTINKSAVENLPHGQEQGGLSGKPLTQMSTQIVADIRKHLPDMPLIASGGVMSAQDMQDKLDAGADLVQIYSGLIFKGPALIKECFQALKANN